MPVADFFDALYIINLRTRVDRREEMGSELRRIGLDPEASPVIFYDAARPAEHGGFPTIGTHGCFLSHLGVLRAAHAAGHRCILLLEDDVNFEKNFQQQFERIRPLLDKSPWQIAYLGALAVTPPLQDAQAVSELPSDSGVLGAHMMALQGNVLGPMVGYLEAILGRPPGDPAGGPMHVDGAYTRFRQSHPEVRTLLCTPPLGYQRPSRTDIHELKWFDKTPGIRALVGQARRLKAQLRR